MEKVRLYVSQEICKIVRKKINNGQICRLYQCVGVDVKTLGTRKINNGKKEYIVIFDEVSNKITKIIDNSDGCVLPEYIFPAWDANDLSKGNFGVGTILE